MRLLHTADWHLGRLLHRVPLLDAQRQVLDHLIDVARDERVDAIVVAGDLFDRALPPVEAVQLAGDVLRRMADVAPVIVVSGNHDSAQRLGFARELIAAGGVHLRTDPRGSGDPVVLDDEHGPVAIYGIPYVDPDLCRGPLGVEERSHEAVLGAATALARADLAERARTLGPVRSVVVAHAFVQGGEPSDSERDISIGGAQTVSTATFAGFDYVALGHLHRPHAVGGATDGDAAPEVGTEAADDPRATVADDPIAADGDDGALRLFDALDSDALASDAMRADGVVSAAPAAEPTTAPSHAREAAGSVATVAPPTSSPVRYAGSPLAYSFTEADAEKSSAIVEIDAEGRTDVRLVTVPSPYRLVRLRGTLDALLDDPTLAEHERDDHWLEVVLTDARLPARPMERLRRRFPRILVLQHVPDGDLAPATLAAARVRGRSDLEVLERFVDDVRGAAVADAERPLLRRAVEAVTKEAVA